MNHSKPFLLKRLGKLRIRLSFLAGLHIRLLIPEAKQEGYDAHLDLVIDLCRLRMTAPEIFDGSVEAIPSDSDGKLRQIYDSRITQYNQNKSAVDDLYAKAQSATKLIQILRNYFLVRNLSERILQNLEQANECLKKARLLDPKALPLNLRQLAALALINAAKRKMHRTEISDREALKLSLSFQQTGAMIGTLSTFFVLTGYLYNRFFLGEFGIDVALYFRAVPESLDSR